MAVYDVNGNIIRTSPFVSIADYGAKGDGSTDDYEAIQDALDALADTGGTILFPEGIYLISAPLFFYSNQTLFGAGAIIKAKSNTVGNLLKSYCDTSIREYGGVHDAVIDGLTLDGSAYGVNNTLFSIAHTKNVIIQNCKIINAFGLAHNMEINSSYGTRVKNCYLTRTGSAQGNGEMIQPDRATSGAYGDESYADGTICKCIDIYENTFIGNSANPAIGNHNGSHDMISIHDNVFDGFTGARGAIDLSSDNLTICNNLFNGCTTGVTSSYGTAYIHDNRFIGATTAIDASSSVVHNNMINGVFDDGTGTP